MQELSGLCDDRVAAKDQYRCLRLQRPGRICDTTESDQAGAQGRWRTIEIKGGDATAARRRASEEGRTRGTRERGKNPAGSNESRCSVRLPDVRYCICREIVAFYCKLQSRLTQNLKVTRHARHIPLSLIYPLTGLTSRLLKLITVLRLIDTIYIYLHSHLHIYIDI